MLEFIAVYRYMLICFSCCLYTFISCCNFYIKFTSCENKLLLLLSRRITLNLSA